MYLIESRKKIKEKKARKNKNKSGIDIIILEDSTNVSDSTELDSTYMLDTYLSY